MFGIGGPELLVIFLIILLLFGAKRLPEIARSMGKATTEFKKARQELTTMADDTATGSHAPPQRAQPVSTESASADNSSPKSNA